MFLETIWPTTLPLPLEAAKYSCQPQAVETQMDTGRIRRRRQFTDPLLTIDVKWVLGEDEYSVFRTFFVDTLENGTQLFALEIYGTVRAVQFLDAFYSFSTAEGYTTVQATLIVGEEATTETYNPVTDLAASATGPASISLTWSDPSSTNTGFLIQRKDTIGGTFEDLATVGDLETYSDTSCDPGTTYYYQIAAIYASGNSEWSGTVYATTTSLDAPTDLTATMVDGSSIDLSWTDPSSDNTGFLLQRKESGGSYEDIDTVEGITYSDTGLDSGTTYYYRVAAVYAEGTSGWSDEAYATTFDPTACAVTEFSGVSGAIASGGDTFDCYDEDEILTADDLPDGGTGFTGAWVIGLTTRVMGDDFDSYDAQNPLTSTLSGGTGMEDDWLIDVL